MTIIVTFPNEQRLRAIAKNIAGHRVLFTWTLGCSVYQPAITMEMSLSSVWV